MDASFLTALEPQVIVFGGLTIIGVMLVIANIKKDKATKEAIMEQAKLYYNHTNDTIKRNSEALDKVSEAFIKNACSNQQLVDVIKQFHERNK